MKKLLALLYRHLVIFAVIMMTACGGQFANGKQVMKIEYLYSSAQCGGSEESLSMRFYNDADTVMTAVTSMANADVADSVVANIDFVEQRVLHISMGRQSSGGYSIDILSTKLSIKSGTGELHLRLTSPAPGMMVTQALTSPCVMIAMPREGYHSIRLLNQDGDVLLQRAL